MLHLIYGSRAMDTPVDAAIRGVALDTIRATAVRAAVRQLLRKSSGLTGLPEELADCGLRRPQRPSEPKSQARHRRVGT